MSEVYVYGATETDLTTHGLCGALEPDKCIFTEEANGCSELELTHPFDEHGKFRWLVVGRQLVCGVPVRMTPEIDQGQIVTQVEVTTVKETATKAERTLYTKQSGGKKKKVIPGGTGVVIVEQNEEWDRWKIKADKYGTCWIDKDALNAGTEETIDDTTQSIETVAPAWVISPQIFRIYDVSYQIDSVTVRAQHITYDLLFNVTSYRNDGTVALGDALAGVLGSCIEAHDFNGYTNLANERTGVDERWKSPINAILDPDTGLCARYGASIIRDNYDIYLLSDPGVDRGIKIEYRRNMTGVTATINYDSVITQVLPVGKKKDKSDLFLDPETYMSYDDTEQVLIDGTTDAVVVDCMDPVFDYAAPQIEYLDCASFATVSKTLSIALARQRMYEAAHNRFAVDHAHEPQTEMSVEFISLGDTAEYRQFKALESLYLYDYVTIIHSELGLEATAQIAKIEWDVTLERMNRMDIGKVGDTLASVKLASYQIYKIDGAKMTDATGNPTVMRMDADIDDLDARVTALENR